MPLATHIFGSFVCALVTAAAAAATATAPAPDVAPADIFSAALQLKTSAVELTLADCKRMAVSDKTCHELVEMLHARELRVAKRLICDFAHPNLDRDEFGKQLDACYGRDYAFLVACWEQLSQRVDDARRGHQLIKP